MTTDLLAELHDVNPYKGFDASGYRQDLEGWNSNRPALLQMIDLASPDLIIEVGTWKGASAIHMGKYLKKKNPAAKILCIDTWLGSLDFWQDKKLNSKYGSLKLKNGYPTVYYQFLYNVIHNGLTEVIIPFPQTAVVAAQWLQWKEVRADLVYIDASHDEASVYRDISNYEALLSESGIIFGDDYYEGSDGVCAAVDRFAAEKEYGLHIYENQIWQIERTVSVKENSGD